MKAKPMEGNRKNLLEEATMHHPVRKHCMNIMNCINTNNIEEVQKLRFEKYICKSSITFSPFQG